MELKAYLEGVLFMTVRTTSTGAGLMRKARAYLLDKYPYLTEQQVLRISSDAISACFAISNGEEKVEKNFRKRPYQRKVDRANRLAGGLPKLGWWKRFKNLLFPRPWALPSK